MGLIDKPTLALGLAKRLANNNLDPAVVESLATAFEHRDERFAPTGAEICTLGICTDHRLNDHPELVKFIEELNAIDGVGGVQIFPEGIIGPDRFRARVEHIIER